MCSQLNPLFADAYLKPQQTHYVQLVNTTPLFAVGYQKPLQTHDSPQLVLIWLPEVSSGYRCVAS